MTVASPRPRPARQGLTDFTLPVQRADIDAIVPLPGETAWLLTDRQAGFDAFETLPAESNPLYTTYFDLRTVQLADAALTPSPRTPRDDRPPAMRGRPGSGRSRRCPRAAPAA